eukprot:354903-Chlamydomonas_euryale.AAC.27
MAECLAEGLVSKFKLQAKGGLEGVAPAADVAAELQALASVRGRSYIEWREDGTNRTVGSHLGAVAPSGIPGRRSSC